MKISTKGQLKQDDQEIHPEDYSEVKGLIKLLEMHRYNNRIHLYSLPKLKSINETFIKYYNTLEKIGFRPDKNKKYQVIDLGAHHGVFSIFLSKKLSCKIDCYEANPVNADILNLNLETNQCRNVFLHNVAVNDKKGSCYFSFGRTSTTGKMTSVRWNHKKTKKRILVKSTTINDVLKQSGGFIDIVKCDVEGSEYGFVDDLLRMRNKIGYLIIELHPVTGKAMLKVLEQMFINASEMVITKMPHGCVEVGCSFKCEE